MSESRIIIKMSEANRNRAKYAGYAGYARICNQDDSRCCSYRGDTGLPDGNWGSTTPTVKIFEELVAERDKYQHGDGAEMVLWKVVKKEHKPGDKLCEVAKVLPAQLITMLKAAPKNPSLRAMAMARLKQGLPDKADTWKKIQHWVEHNIDLPDLSPPPAPGPAFEVEVEFSEREYGSCNYSCTARGSRDYGIDSDEVLEIVRTHAAQGMSVVLNSLAERIEELASEDPPETETDDDTMTYDGYDRNESDSSEYSVSRNEIRDQLTAWLSANHPELLDRLT